MSWIRLDDDYIYHPKFAVLSNASFRLWHEGMAYCRKMLTDGLIPQAAMKTFRYAARGAVSELTTPIGDGLAPLWETHDAGFKVHDYLVWNRSREQELKDREESKGRAKKSRNVRRTCAAPAPHGAELMQKREEGSSSVRSLERERERKPTANSKWPIFKGLRLVVHEWQLTAMQSTLGVFAEHMEWDTWLDAADRRAYIEPIIASDWWPWLQSELLIYARREGWPVASPAAKLGKQSTNLQAALANIKAEAEAV